MRNESAFSIVLDETELPKFVHEKLTLERVVPTISANVSCVISIGF